MPTDKEVIQKLWEADNKLADYCFKARQAGELLARLITAETGWAVECHFGDHEEGPDVIRLDVRGAHCLDQLYDYEYKMRGRFDREDGSVSFKLRLNHDPLKERIWNCEEHGKKEESDGEKA